VNSCASRKCELCNSMGDSYNERDGFQYYICKQCDFVWLDLSSSRVDIEELYSAAEASNAFVTRKLEKLAKEIVNLKKDDDAKASFLDIGCQNGTLLGLLESGGHFELYGIEPNANALEICKKLKGVTLFLGFFSSEAFQDKTFQIVNLGDVIEHVESPKNLIEEIHGKLSENGYLIISTPVLDCAWVRNSNLIFGRSNLIPLTFLTPPHHVKYFTSRNLDRVLTQCGFTKVKSWFFPATFFYELANSQIFINFNRSKDEKRWSLSNLARKLNIFMWVKFFLFSAVYGISRIQSELEKSDFSYTVVYQKNL
jgi:2-polyprenyl-3-methyl-5-hydroxy-6-metoxy-1,4-benzoquinol methylase